MALTPPEYGYIALCLEGFLFGIYSGVFAMYLKYHSSKEDDGSSTKQNRVFHALCLLYVLSVGLLAFDITSEAPPGTFIIDVTVAYRLSIAEGVFFGCCDFIAQSILIHRCWIVWGQNTRVVIFPSILAFAFLVIWMATISSLYIQQGTIGQTTWGYTLVLTGLTASMTVNAVVTGLIVFKIFKVFQRVKSVTTSQEKSLGITGGRQLRSLIFVIIESGMALFAIQLARVAITATLVLTVTEFNAFQFIGAIQQMLNGITPTIILVRVSLGLSFHDQESLAEVVGSLRFAADGPNPASGTESIDQDGSLHLEHDDNLEIYEERRSVDNGRSDKIQVADSLSEDS